MTDPVQGLFFDIDGTLVDSNGLHVDAWEEAFRDAGYPQDRATLHDQIGKGADTLIPTLLPDVPDAVRETMAERHGAIFKGRYLEQVTPLPGATALLRHVHAAGQKLVVASSASAAEVAHYLALLGVADIVDLATSADDAGRSKPAPDIFAVALDRSGLSPAEVRVVGDSPYDMEAACRCGIAPVGVLSGGFDEATLRAAGAVAIYRNVADLLERYPTSPLAG